MDSLFLALSCYRRRKYEDCVNHCSKLLEKNPYDQAAWALKTCALTQQVYIDEVEAEEQGIVEMIMDDNAMAQVSRSPEESDPRCPQLNYIPPIYIQLRGQSVSSEESPPRAGLKGRDSSGPGTSLKIPNTSGGPSPSVRPVSQAGRPLSGFVRPGTQSGRPNTMEQALKTPRTLHTARPITSASGRFVRLGTASMLSHPDGPFINLSRLNYGKYAAQPSLAKILFEYILHHENDVRNALELAALASEHSKFTDSWWKVQLGKCYHRLGMFRDAEQQYNSALKQQIHIDTVLLLGKVYQRLDQPLQAIAVYKRGLEQFPEDASLKVATARIYDGMSMTDDATKWYKDVLICDGVNIEAIASIAANYFYTDQPEIAIRLYRRLIQMGVYNVELFNNIGLSCFYAQQYDMTLKCFERALSIATDEEIADVWYNISHLALGVGDNTMAYQCLRLAVAADNGHAEAYNNLAVLELRRGDIERAKALFRSAGELNPQAYEPHYNQATLCESLGDLQTSYSSVLKSVDAFNDHVDSKVLLKNLRQHFSSL